MKVYKRWQMIGMLSITIWISLFGDKLKACIKVPYMVRMTDGTYLAVDIYLPRLIGSFPVVLIRTPYGKSGLEGYAETLCDRDYAVVVQDTRGRGASQGTDWVFWDDGWGINRDGYDTCNWIKNQLWCNGKIGTVGASALGILEYLLAGAVPPNLICQYAEVAAPSLYHYVVFPGGEFRKSMIEGWLANQGSLHVLPIWLANYNYGMFWDFLNAETRHSLINCAGYHVGGWFDCFSQGTINQFVGLQKNGAPGAKGNQKLLIGPWTHGGAFQQQQGELIFPENSLYQNQYEMYDWLDYWLKGVQNGIMEKPAVKYYTMGDCSDPEAPGNVWRTSNTWPPEGYDYIAYYLHRDGTLSPQLPAEFESFTTYTYDPNNPVPTIGGGELLIPPGPYKQNSIEDRNDVLIFTTPPLDAPMDMTGKIKVVLFASSDCPDTDWTAKITDVYPDGSSYLIQDGILMARHRESLSTEVFMNPGEVYRFEFDLWDTSIIFNRGHRIRLAISSSNYPRFEVNPNTGEPVRQNTHTRIARNTIHHSSQYPSHILLPVKAPEITPSQTPTKIPTSTPYTTKTPTVIPTSTPTPTITIPPSTPSNTPTFTATPAFTPSPTYIPSHLAVAGYWDTRLTTNGGRMMMIAFTLDNLTEQISVLYQGIQTGISLLDDGLHNDGNADDGVFGFVLDLPSDLNPMIIELEFVGEDKIAQRRGIWPYLVVK